MRASIGTIQLAGGANTPRAYPGIECVEDPELKPGDVLIIPQSWF